jgi:hypothetical protein
LKPDAKATQGDRDRTPMTAALLTVREPKRGSMRKIMRRLDTCTIAKAQIKCVHVKFDGGGGSKQVSRRQQVEKREQEGERKQGQRQKRGDKESGVKDCTCIATLTVSIRVESRKANISRDCVKSSNSRKKNAEEELG